MQTQEESSCTLSEAAVAVGRAESTIRFWLQNKIITGKKVKDGSWVISRSSLLLHAAAAEPLRVQRRIRGASSNTTAPRNEEQLFDALRGQIATLSQALDHERSVSRDLRMQNKELQGEFLKLTAEIKAILEREDKSLLSRWIRK